MAPTPVYRNQRFTRFCDTIRSSRDTLVGELVNVKLAVDHEFRNGVDRDNYVAYLYALGRFQYGDHFEEAVREALNVNEPELTGPFPKIRLYQQRRFRDNVLRWEYLGSTTQARSILDALRLAGRFKVYNRKHKVRAEYAATHGYYIED